jgi:hypothetical protein
VSTQHQKGELVWAVERQECNAQHGDALLSMSSRPPPSSDAPEDAGATTVAPTEALDAELSSATFTSAGDSGLSVTTTVEEAEAGSSDGTGSGTAALAVSQPEAGTAKRRHCQEGIRSD